MSKLLLVVLDTPAVTDSCMLFHALQADARWHVASGYADTPNETVIARLSWRFKHSLLELEKLITEHVPSHLVLLAQNRMCCQLMLEKVALNINHSTSADHAGLQPDDTLTAEHGAAAYFCNISLNAMKQALQQQQIPVQLSYHAGTDVANHVFYGLMHYIKHQNTRLQGGLITSPLLPQQSCANRSASIGLPLLLQALRISLEACVNGSGQA